MGCKPSKKLPHELIERIQEYVDGETVYIPKKPAKRGNASSPYKERNDEIYEKYRSGASVKKLAEEYYISTQGIYKILTKYK